MLRWVDSHDHPRELAEVYRAIQDHEGWEIQAQHEPPGATDDESCARIVLTTYDPHDSRRLMQHFNEMRSKTIEARMIVRQASERAGVPVDMFEPTPAGDWPG